MTGDKIGRLLASLGRLPDWLRSGRPDLEQAHRRRLSPRYRSRKRRVKTLWLGAGVLMILLPHPTLVALTVLIMTFASFAILDESD